MVSIHKTYTNLVLLLCLTLLLVQTASAQFTGRSWSAFTGGAKAVCDDELDSDTSNDDIDNDDDGLIELCYLEDVDAMRHDNKGASLRRGSKTLSAGCPSSGCNGYELVRDLDFNDDDSYESTSTNNVKVNWTTGGGFPMIVYERKDFSATLEGNGHTISNLFMNNTIGNLRRSGFIDKNNRRIQNLGLSKINLILSLEDAFGSVASLTRDNSGVIINSYVQGRLIFGIDPAVSVSSAFVGDNNGTISNSYVDTFVGGSITGFFAWGNSGTISDSYTKGDLKSISEGTSSFVGDNYDQISNIYQAIDDYPDNLSYALVEINNDPDGLVTNSYWDSTKWRGADGVDSSGGMSENVLGFTTAKLQQSTRSTVNTDPYYKWDTNNWDFGTSNQYPALKYAKYAPGDTKNHDNLACGKSQQPVCSTLLRGQRNNQPRIISPENNTKIVLGESDAGTAITISVTVSDKDIKDKLTLFLSAKDEKQNLVILETAKTEVITNGSPEREPNQNLSIRVPQVVMTGMTDLHLVAEDDSDLDNAISEPVLLKVIATGNTRPTITPIPPGIRLLEETSTTLNVVVRDADGDEPIVSIDSNNLTVATATIIARSDLNHTRTLEITGSSKGTAMITVTADDGKRTPNSTTTVTFMVEVEANEAPTISITELKQRLQVNDMEELTVSVSDANFDVNDKVTLSVKSSAPSVVSVVGQSEVTVTGDDTDKVFMLNAEAGGDATITISAEDSKEAASNSEMVSLRVNAPPMLTISDEPDEIEVGEEATFSVTVSDVNIDDTLILQLTAAEPNQEVVELVTTNVTVMPNRAATRNAQTLRIKGLKVGTATLNIVVADADTTSEPVLLEVRTVRNTRPTITPIPPGIRLLEETSTTLNVVVRDADGDEPIVSIDSNNLTVATATIIARSDLNHTRTLEITGSSKGTAMITVTADDGKRTPNSTTTVTFMVEVEANEAPTISITKLNQRLQVNDMVELTVSVSDANFDVNDEVTLSVKSSAPLVVSVDRSEIVVTGDDTDQVFMLNAEAGGDATITISAEDSKEAASNSEMVSLHVNAPPTLTISDEPDEIEVGEEATFSVTVSDVNIDDTLILQLTAADPNQEVVELVTTNVPVMPIRAATRNAQTLRIKGLKAGTATLNIVVADADTTSEPVSLEVTVTVTSMQVTTWREFPGGAIAACANDDIDDDDDGLIELCYLEDVDAMREDLEGTSLKRGDSTLTDGCPSSGCKGYELVRDLDFSVGTSYSLATNIVEWTVDDYTNENDNGWQPIGDFANLFNSTFEGNGHSISNLMINRPDDFGDGDSIGLFGYTDSSSKISNISLLSVKIVAYDEVAGLVANNSGSIMNSYVTGSVNGNSNLGGLVADNSGSIMNSYATGSVNGNNNSLGGLVNVNSGTIKNSYATGSVTGTLFLGGLVNVNSGTIEDSYATGSVTSTRNQHFGGLVRSNRGTISDAYWDTEKSGISTSGGGVGKMTAALTGPRTNTEIYSEWSPDNWDFGTPNQYPALKYGEYYAPDDKEKENNLACDNSQQPACGTLLPGQREINNPPTITPNADGQNIRLLEDTSTTLNVVIKDADGDTITVMPPISSDDTITTATIKATGNANYTLEITARSASTATITVTVNDGQEEINSEATETFMVEVVANEKPTVDIVTPPSPTILLDAETNVVISIADANFDLGDSVKLEVTESTSSVVSGIPEDDIVINSNTNRTFTFTGLKVGETRISFTATDSSKDQQSDTVSVLLSVFSSLALTDNVPTEDIIVPINEMYSLDTKPFFTQSGSGISYAATGLPNGLTFTGGVISGSPTTASTNKNGSVTVTASDGRGGSADATFTLLINAEPTGAVTIGFNDITWRLTATNNVTDANVIAETNYQWFRGNTKIGTNRIYMIPDTNTGRAGGTEYKVEVEFVDNIGQSVTRSSAIYTINNEAPVINAISQITVNEDIAKPDEPTVTINPRVTDANHDSLTYTWSVTSEDPSILRDVTKTNKRLQFNVPPNWIKDTSPNNVKKKLQLKITVTEIRDGGETTTQTASVVVTKKNNGASATSPGIDRDDNTNELTLKTGTDNTAIAADPDNGGDEDSIRYQWQWCQSPCSSSWTDIDGQTGSAYTIPATIGTTSVEDNDRFRLEISYTDGQGYSETIFTNSEAKSATADIKVRAKVFLEGPLQ